MTTLRLATREARKVIYRGANPATLALVPDIGPLAYDGPDAIVCPECKVALDPLAYPREGEVPKHAPYGYVVHGLARMPCRGHLDSGAIRTDPGRLRRELRVLAGQVRVLGATPIALGSASRNRYHSVLRRRRDTMRQLVCQGHSVPSVAEIVGKTNIWVVSEIGYLPTVEEE